MPVLHVPAPRLVTEMFAWVMTYPDGREGVPATTRLQKGVLMPLMGGNRALVEAYRGEAMRVANVAGVQVKLLHWAGPPAVLVAPTFPVHRGVQ
jgi:hypothetical protein